MPIHMQILPQVLHMLDNLNFFLLLVTKLPVSIQCFIFLTSVKGVVYELYRLLGIDTDPEPAK